MLLRELALIPLVDAKALIGFPECEEPNVPKEAGANEAGEKVAPRELLDMAAIGDKPDMAPIGFWKDIPG